VVTCIESANEDKEIALGAFLDIKGASDNTSFDVITQAAERHGTEPITCGQICLLLESINIIITLSGETSRGSTAEGCPQGDVLSALL
jgi:hypothetical protein